MPNNTYYRNNSKFSSVLWHNENYGFYYVKKHYPNYAFYWQFDYDIFFNGKSYDLFLNKYSNNNSDLLALRPRKEFKNSKWYWSSDVDWIYNDNVQLWGSFAPIIRLSNQAIDYLYKKRIEHKEIFNKINQNNKKWVNCELFIPTELYKSNFIYDEIIEPNVHLGEYDLNEDRIFENQDNLIYHPVKGQFLERIKNKKTII